MLSSTLLDALMSIIRNVPSGRAARAMAGEYLAGVGLVVHRVERRDQVEGIRLVQLRRVAPLETGVSQTQAPCLGVRPRDRPPREKSKPTNRLAGYSRAKTLIACPLPQPTSATSIPARSRASSPSTSGTTTFTRAASTNDRLASLSISA